MCNHTYVRWENGRYRCSNLLCDKTFDWERDPRWIGTFARKDIEDGIKNRVRRATNSTASLWMPETISLSRNLWE